MPVIQNNSAWCTFWQRKRRVPADARSLR